MRSIRLLLVPLLLAGCTDSNPATPDVEVSPLFAAAHVGWTEGVAYDDYTVFCPCVGEEMRFTGSFWYRIHGVVNEERENWTALYGSLPDYHAVGLTTGHIWVPKPPLRQTEILVAPPGKPLQVYQTTAVPFSLVNRTTGETLSWPIRVHWVRNAAGEVKVDFRVEPCRVR